MFTRIDKEGNMRNKTGSNLPEKWRSDYLNGIQVVGGSNPLTPTSDIKSLKSGIIRVLLDHLIR